RSRTRNTTSSTSSRPTPTRTRACVGAEMQAQARVLVGVGLELVELVVFLVLDLVLRAEPERLDGVDMLAVEIDREGDKGAVALEDFLDAALGRVFGAVVLQLDDDLGAAGEALSLLDFVAAGAVARP